MIQKNLGMLTIIASERIKKADSQFVLSDRTITGLKLYSKFWPGKVQYLAQEDTQNSVGINNKRINQEDVPFLISIEDFKSNSFREKYLDSALVLFVLADMNQLEISKNCYDAKIPCVGIAILSFSVSLQILFCEKRSVVSKFKSFLWNLLLERKIRKSLSFCSAIQCNGVPAYEGYKKLIKNSLLVFDSRSGHDKYITKDALEKRLKNLDNNDAIRLVFSGRLIQIKGADHLINVANILKKKNINFTFNIFGNGDLSDYMEAEIERLELTDCVNLRGAVDYDSVLRPYIQEECDIFVLCHRQGDPAHTYLETYSCGVPMVGYKNDAFSGILKLSDVGWDVKLNDYNAVADKIIELSLNRKEIKTKSFNALKFAEQHTFEETFQKRIDHLKEIVG